MKSIVTNIEPLAIMILLCLSILFGASSDLSKSNKIGLNDLLQLGKGYTTDNGKSDSAVIVLSEITFRYTPEMSSDEKEIILAAYETLAHVYLSNYFDYEKASQQLQKALTLCDEINHDKSRIYLSVGLINHTLIDSHESPELLPAAKRYYLSAIDEAVKHNNVNTGVVALINLVEVARELECLDEILPQFKLVKSLQENPEVPEDLRQIYKNACERHAASAAMIEGNYQKSIDILSAQLNDDNLSRLNPSRHKSIILLFRSEVYSKNGEWLKAINDLNEVVSIANAENMQDLKMSALRHLADFHDTIGLKTKADQLRVEYLLLRDSVISYRQVASVNELQVMEKMHSMDKEMTTVRLRNKLAVVIIIVILIIMVAIVGILVTVKRKNRIITLSNEKLYQKNVELLEAEELQRKQRISNDVEETSSNMGEEEPKREKYQNSLLDEATKDNLMIKLTDLMSQDEVVCATDFSSEKLSQMMGVPYKYLSQVINERYGANFNSFVNEYRIKAACRIMGIPKAEEMTVEGIANMVGFKSRSAFSRIFKSETGLTPSEYLNMAKTKRKEGKD